MFGWLTEHTREVVSWIRAISDFVEDSHQLHQEDYSWEALQDILKERGIEECPQEIWDTIVRDFPDLIDEVNDLRLRIFNDGKHPDDSA